MPKNPDPDHFYSFEERLNEYRAFAEIARNMESLWISMTGPVIPSILTDPIQSCLRVS